MLKFLGVIFGLIFFASIACASSVSASPTPVVLTQIQAGGIGSATQEMVVIYNNSPEEVDLTSWCLSNKSNVLFACFSSADPYERLYLPSYGYATVATDAMSMAIGFEDFTIIYPPTNQSSGSIVGSADTIKLLDASGQEVDKHSWTTSLPSGMLLSRVTSADKPYLYEDTDTASDWLVQSPQFIPDSSVEYRPSDIVDVCPNIEGAQSVTPFDKEFDDQGNCIDTSIGAPKLMITELLPNAAGSDVGQEFIELYNPSSFDISLEGYELWVGPSFEKSYDFPSGAIIAAGEYRAFSNSEVSFSLLNSSSRVRITTSSGATLHETPAYQGPKDDQSWALIDNVWKYTSLPTPGEPNVEGRAAGVGNSSNKDTRKPCADNQFRNPATGRCKLLASTGGSLKPCNPNQYRSQETNRCRNISSSTSSLKPCEKGQERNPDTNRCRMVTKIPNADYSVLGAQTNNSGTWYMWAAIGGILLLAVGYAVWEWHSEIGRFFQRLQRFVRPNK